MKNIKKTLAGLTALTLVLGLTACGSKDSGGSGDNGGGGGEAAATTTTAPQGPAETTTQTLAEEDAGAIEGAMGMLRDIDLGSNTVVKWLSNWDINPKEGEIIDPGLALFQTKYNGIVQYYPCEWADRFDTLSRYVLGGEGIDLFPFEEDCLPKGIINGMFQPIDDYIEINGPLWTDMKSALDVFNFGGKHYLFVNSVSADHVVIYSAKTIEENGLDDPWELFEEGKWDWDTFANSLQEFVDADDEHEGLDGWWSETALYRSGGVPFIQTVNGELTMNMFSPELEGAQNFMLDLFNRGLVMDKAEYSWAEQPQFMGEGRELYYITGSWAIMGPPDGWSTKIDPEDVRFAPVPCRPGAEHPTIGAKSNGYCLVKDGGNPQGAALLADCARAAGLDPDTKELNHKKCLESFQWPEETYQQLETINELAAKYPVIDLSSGMSSDIESLTVSNQNKSVGLNASLHGVDWATTRESYVGALDVMVDEVKAALEAKLAE